MINIQGNSMIEAKPDIVWGQLFEVDSLINLVPGCKDLKKINEHEYQGLIQIGVAAVQGTYTTRIFVNQYDDSYICELKGDVIGPTGTIQGNGSFQLKEVAGFTNIEYYAKALMIGALAKLNPRFIEGVVGTLIKQGIGKLNKQIRANSTGDLGK
jgi:carbon monoxide dehydrogenase subunit G